jgi:hypothetical protein
MNYESAPNGVSYEALLKVIEVRSTMGRPYEERLYLVELTNKLADLSKKTSSRPPIDDVWDKRSDWGSTY